ncbi:hypothetical protein BDFB_014730 [Asbolus verrucosus]|uniref:Uncharacterized protein n=1 Tax=Asbolus verrucosus TaxID=1661398 RepID=A0A482VHS9_ASBVE|nr:hypothetical protein BDFB_014730 [Asbolus verrucosus]
MGPQKHQLLRW